MKKKQESTALEPARNADQLTHTEVTATQQSIQNCILTIRGQQVMLDRDLAVLYGVEAKYLNRQVKRNIERFPEDFMFQLTKEESSRCQFGILNTDSFSDSYSNMSRSRCQIGTLNTDSFSEVYDDSLRLRFQFGTSNNGRGNNLKYLPYAFTENGIAMLSSVLRSQTAIEVNIRIMRAFTAMRQFLNANAQMFQKLEVIENHQLRLQEHVEEHDRQFEMVLKQLEEKEAKIPTQRIFYDGQIYDAHSFVCDLIKEAKERIVVVDNYLDNTVLTRLAYREAGLPVTIFTKAASSQFTLDVEKHNAQYPGVTVHVSNKAHDRFLIIDNKVYHLGASIKDLGKKIFAFNLMEEDANELLKRLK